MFVMFLYGWDAAHTCSSEADTESEAGSESEDEGETDRFTQKEAPEKVQRQDSVDGTAQEEFYALEDSDDEKQTRAKKRGKNNKKKSKKNKKQGNKKKKQKPDMPWQTAGLADVLPGAAPGKKKKKKNKNSKKRRQAKEPNMAKADPTDYEVFDYGKAESVIKSNPAQEGQQDGPKKRGRAVQKVFNKNLQGDIKPARGKNYKRPGKTQTFN